MLSADIRMHCLAVRSLLPRFCWRRALVFGPTPRPISRRYFAFFGDIEISCGCLFAEKLSNDWWQHKLTRSPRCTELAVAVWLAKRHRSLTLAFGRRYNDMEQLADDAAITTSTLSIIKFLAQY